MNSHEYARQLQELAAFLLSKPQFDTRYNTPEQYLWYSTGKEQFLGAVKALGTGTKEYSDEELKFRPNELLTLVVSRSAVCHKVQEEKWECEPLLSQEEEAQIGAGV